ncbi:MAG: prepilin peptidase [Candidatus Eremiobacteraeota bacterium]|nr:prepilin peptidase [Candidatus Eremiobacteraeota bacterium]MBV8584022.1 prepilin peptidase [Candidatus Eremiobacteraeota bacterium]
MSALLPYVCSLIACAAAAVTDLRTRRIPNTIPLALALFGVTFNVFGGWRPALSAVAAGILVLVVGTLPFSLGALGGGDVKLLAACGCVFGLSELLPLVVYTALIGGAVALVFLVLRRISGTKERVRLPYAIAIAGGVLWISLADTALPHLKIV